MNDSARLTTPSLRAVAEYVHEAIIANADAHDA